MAKITLNTILSSFGSTSLFNTNFSAIQTELNDKVLYRDNPGSEPNQMLNDLDMNSNNIANANNINTQTLTVGGVPIIGTVVEAMDVTYDNSTSGLTATDVQAVIDEVDGLVDTNTTDIADTRETSDYKTYGGTANAITLTSSVGVAVTALTTGMQFRFKATSSNTAASTIAVDGLSAVAVKTVTGVDTPADYIRTDVITTVTYDGTNFIANRMVEKGSNSNGNYTIYEDGTAIEGITDNGSAGVVKTVTLPLQLQSGYYGSCTSSASTTATQLVGKISNQTTTTLDFGIVSSTSFETVQVDIILYGEWY